MNARTAHNGVNLIGKRFNRLVVLSRAENSKRNYRRWVCQCDCGKQTTVITAALLNGHTRSCGCYGEERRKKHGRVGTKEYNIWGQMKQRCLNPNDDTYYRYGARGITVCERWSGPDGFVNFFADMGTCPEGRSLDRIDNSAGYAPENCRWADNATQYRNRGQTIWIEYNGETKCRKDWAIQYGIDDATLAQRLSRGWSIEKALLTPPMNSGGGKRYKKEMKV